MGVGSWEFGRLEGLIGRFLMSPEGRNVKDSYSLSLEFTAVLNLAPSGEFLPSVLRISPLRPQIISAWLLINSFSFFPLILKLLLSLVFCHQIRRNNGRAKCRKPSIVLFLIILTFKMVYFTHFFVTLHAN